MLKPVYIRNFILLIILLAIHCSLLHAQVNEDDEIPKIQVLARPTKTTVKLRWAPNTPIAWRETHKYGFIIERYTFIRDSVVLPKVEKTILTVSPVKPWPLEKWEVMVDTSDLAAIAAQAIYGESFEITGAESDIAYMINKARELESRFSFALFAASQSKDVAIASGLYYEDKTAKKNEKYLYRIYSPIPPEGVVVDTGFILTGIPDYSPLPPPKDIRADFGDKAVMLSWNRSYYDRIYNNYIIERSTEDTLSFKVLSDLPFINTSPTDKPETPYMFKVDTLPENNVTYHYRIRGKTPFGETGPPSEIISGMGIPSLNYQPYIQQVLILENKATEITWDFAQEGLDLLQGYAIERTGDPNKPYIQINDELIPASTFTYRDNNPQTVNYYRVKAIGKTGNESVSFPYLAQLEDSIPPAPPTGLQGIVDTTGRVILRWNANIEPDLAGYRVYRSNFANGEFSQVTHHPVNRPLFIDSINIKTLTENIYYKVVAIDRRFNPSDFSTVAKLQRPDITPPAPPVFKTTRADEKGVYLSWANSNSTDVVKHVLYRRKNGDARWTVIGVFQIEDSIYSFFDSTITSKEYYDYTMIAVDDSKLESKPTNPITTKRIDLGIRDEIKNFYGKPDRENKNITLKWTYPEPGVNQYVIYKSTEDEPYSTFKSVAGEQNELLDKTVVLNTIYKYRIKAFFANGDESLFSKEVIVNY